VVTTDIGNVVNLVEENPAPAPKVDGYDNLDEAFASPSSDNGGDGAESNVLKAFY
jgi:hypothetical protein